MKTCNLNHDAVAYDSTTCPVCRMRSFERETRERDAATFEKQLAELKAEKAALERHTPPRFVGRGNNYEGYFLEETGLYEALCDGLLISGIHNETYSRVWILQGDHFNVTGNGGPQGWRKFMPLFDVAATAERIGDCIPHTEVMKHNRGNQKRPKADLEKI